MGQLEHHLQESQVLLLCKGVTVDFDGFVAVDQVDFQLQEKELRFLIGPNGAGKTTLLDLLCGKVKPTKGEILFKGQLLNHLQEHQIIQLGIGRKFQNPSVFESLTVLENMELAMKQSRSMWSTFRAKLTAEALDEIYERLSTVGMLDKLHFKAGALSHGEKQWLEISMLLVQKPELLLFDEPVAGMSKSETEKTGQILEEIARHRTALVIEHDMEFVRHFSQRVIVMHMGRIFRDGTMDDIQSDPDVVEIYFGKMAKRREADALR